eukprot:COSAG02_NODE_10895_length_1836_cov_2.218192_1_plen_60_part_00
MAQRVVVERDGGGGGIGIGMLLGEDCTVTAYAGNDRERALAGALHIGWVVDVGLVYGGD